MIICYTRNLKENSAPHNEHPEKNIASLVRNSTDGINLGKIDNKVFKAMVELGYVSVPGEVYAAEKGFWVLYKRQGFAMPRFLEDDKKEPLSGFVAVYYDNGEPRTLFSGNETNRKAIVPAMRELTDKVLEQRDWFAWPPKKLTKDDAQRWGHSIAEYGLILGAGFLAVDFAVNYFSKLHGNDYHGLAYKVFDSFTNYPAKTALVALSAPLLLFPIFEFFGKRLGSFADRIREKNLPKQFLYGEKAEKAIMDEYRTLLDQRKLSAFYESIKDFVLLDKLGISKLREAVVALPLGEVKQALDDHKSIRTKIDNFLEQLSKKTGLILSEEQLLGILSALNIANRY